MDLYVTYGKISQNPWQSSETSQHIYMVSSDKHKAKEFAKKLSRNVYKDNTRYEVIKLCLLKDGEELITHNLDDLDSILYTKSDQIDYY